MLAVEEEGVTAEDVCAAVVLCPCKKLGPVGVTRDEAALGVGMTKLFVGNELEDPGNE